MARRPIGRGTHTGGSLAGGPGTSFQDGPNDIMNVLGGRLRSISNPFLTDANLGGTAAVAATNTVFTVTAIGAAPAGISLDIALPAGGQPFKGLTAGQYTPTSENAKGSQFVQAPTGVGLFGDLSGGTENVVYDPPLIVTYGIDCASAAVPLNNMTVAFGLLETDAAVLGTTGAVAVAGNGAFFRIPQGSGGVSSPIECHWHSNGASVASFTSARTYSNGESLQLGVRLVIRQLTNVAAPVMTGHIEYWLNNRLLTSFNSNGNTVPLNIGPGFAGVAIAGNSPWRIAHMAMSLRTQTGYVGA